MTDANVLSTVVSSEPVTDFSSVVNLFQTIFGFIIEQFSRAADLVQQNAVNLIFIVGITYVIRVFLLKSMENDIIAYFVAFIITMVLSFVWVGLLGGFVDGGLVHG